MIAGYEGTPAAVDAPAARRSRPALTELGGEPPGRGARAGLGRRPLRRAVPARLDARRRRARETLETATYWSRLREVYDAVPAALTRRSLGESAHSCCATSRTSTRPGPRCTSRWPPPRATTRSRAGARPRHAAMDAIVAAGGTITHHHAVGTDHQPWLGSEIGPVGFDGAARRQGRGRPRRDPQPRRPGPLRSVGEGPDQQLSRDGRRDRQRSIGLGVGVGASDLEGVAGRERLGQARAGERTGHHERIDRGTSGSVTVAPAARAPSRRSPPARPAAARSCRPPAPDRRRRGRGRRLARRRAAGIAGAQPHLHEPRRALRRRPHCASYRCRRR